MHDRARPIFAVAWLVPALSLGCTSGAGGSSVWRVWSAKQRVESRAGPAVIPLVVPAEASVTADSVKSVVKQVTVQLEMLRIEAPIGSFCGKSKIWELLDEAPAPALRTVTMRENGFRYGVGCAAARRLFKERLESIPNMRVAHDRAMPSAERPLEIEVSDTPRDLATFVFNDAGSMAGQSFEKARPILQIFFRLYSIRDKRVEFRVIPELREPTGPPRYVKHPDGYRQEPEYRGQVFDSMQLTATLDPGSFLVIGPTAELRQMPLLGTPFFLADETPEARESLYVLIPQLDETTSWWSLETASADVQR